jgi:zinc transport system substrate-binding protein
MIYRLFILIIIIFNIQHIYAAEINIVTSIKPLQSLISSITKDLANVELIVNQNSSPHHYNLKPSDLKHIAKADLVFFISDDLEYFMHKYASSDDKKFISLMNNNKISLLHNNQDKDAHHGHDHGHHHFIDPHIWLSPKNAIAIIEIALDKIIELDIKNKEIYIKNASKAIDEINKVDVELKDATKHYQSDSFIALHDSLNYFANYYNLNYHKINSPSHDTPMTLQQLKDLENIIVKQNIKCIIKESYINNNHINKLSEKYNINIVDIDTEYGEEIHSKYINIYISLIKNIATDLATCLNKHNTKI